MKNKNIKFYKNQTDGSKNNDDINEFIEVIKDVLGYEEK